MLKHGGGLNYAAKMYGIAVENWIDLSTGINPNTWPVPNIPLAIYNRLPEDDDALEEHARKYYQTKSLLSIPGSQAAIQLLPNLRLKSRVAVPKSGYAEHAHAWCEAGHQVDFLTTEEIDKNIHTYDVVVVINPNNPTGELIEVKTLLAWYEILQKKSGWLIVDEAFIDTQPEKSLGAYAHDDGLIVLRSLGKFFGLAGVRSGFVLAEEKLLRQIQVELGPWAVSGPTRYVSQLAVQDVIWQQSSIEMLKKKSLKLKKILKDIMLKNNIKSTVKGTDLFQTVYFSGAESLHIELARNGILTRLLDDKSGIRFGLGKESQLIKLESVMRKILSEKKLNI